MKNLFVLTLTLLTFSIHTYAQFINAFAGIDSFGYNGDGIPATSAALADPLGLAVDASGNVYFSDAGNNRIRKVNTAGIISTVAGNGIVGYKGDDGLADSAELNDVQGIAVDDTGNIYIADTYNNRIRKINTSGIIITIAGNGIEGFGGDSGLATLAKLDRPISVTVDNGGNIYIVDQYNYRIRKVSTSGIITTIAGNGTYGYSGDGGPATSASFEGAYGIAVDDTGNVYFADFDNSCVRKVSTLGIITSFAGGTGGYGYSGDGGPATAALFFNTADIAIDGGGNMYIADLGNRRIRKIDASGIVSTVVGDGITGNTGNGGPADSAEIWSGCWVATGNGNVYLSDYTYNVIRRVGWLTGVNQLSLPIQNITIYPNPTVTSLTITSSDKIDNIIIYNLLGQSIYSQWYNSENVQVDVANLSSGIYFIQINGTDSYQEIRKFIKE